MINASYNRMETADTGLLQVQLSRGQALKTFCISLPSVQCGARTHGAG